MRQEHSEDYCRDGGKQDRRQSPPNVEKAENADDGYPKSYGPNYPSLPSIKVAQHMLTLSFYGHPHHVTTVLAGLDNA